MVLGALIPSWHSNWTLWAGLCKNQPVSVHSSSRPGPFGEAGRSPKSTLMMLPLLKFFRQLIDIYVYVKNYMYIHVYLYIYIYISIYLFICMYIYIYTDVYIYTCVCIWISSSPLAQRPAWMCSSRASASRSVE